MKLKLPLLAFALMLVTCNSWGQTITGQFTIEGARTWNLSLTQDASNPDVYDLTNDRYFGAAQGVTGTVALTEFNVDVDPRLSYSVAVTNTSFGSTSYVFSYSAPIILGAGASLVKASLGITLTDGAFDGANLTPHLGSFVQTAYLNGILIPSMNLGGLSIFGTPGDTDVFSYNTGAYSPGPNGPAGTLTIVNSFTLSAGDSVGFSGRVDIIPVPEPSTSAFLLLGLIIGAAVWRRQSMNQVNVSA
jgi:hypothetical protein